MRSGSLLRALLGLSIVACASSDGGSTPVDDARPATPAPSASAPAQRPVLATIKARVRHQGPADGALSVGVFSENPPRSKPPVAFATSKAPTFPFDAELRGIEPGRYWVIAVLDRAPTSSGALRPGPEDVLAASDAIDVTAGASLEVEVDLGGGGDAGAGDAATD